MIKSFKSKIPAKLYETEKSAKIDKRLVSRICIRLDRLNVAEKAEEMNLPGFDFRALNGFKSTRYTVHVNGPWCLTFEFSRGDVYRVDLEQYH
ncbi:type II toxin-antitoxin system RelE/ParE family toxin [Candidatus Tokpelaia sp.]|uniref:type II toxin-antitoxin system RelE/ParE family toxin n=1 Tax=Candidatus Tokpelaia sp. TaxID=2233777 RepID=UPI001238F4CB|nr:type II toxin-antitoxin system RelE/ParE family toxin [Candidatus Tokpelaia sp.]KAA6404744.1 plasmid maintenance system killer [Candidatus Tokpelaia sp.]